MAKLNPYLEFDGTAAQAMAFYQSVFGGELQRNTYAEFGQGTPDDADRTMHSHLVTTAGFTLMAADAPAGTPNPGNGTVSITGDETNELTGYWEALSDGAMVTLPLADAPWGDQFGQLIDQFGVTWMVNIAGSGA